LPDWLEELLMSGSLLPQLRQTSRSTARIDRLGWAAGLAFINHGVRVGIRFSSPDQDVLERVTDCFPHGWKPARSPIVDRLYSVRLGEDVSASGGSGPGGRPIASARRRLHRLYVGRARLLRTPDLDAIFRALESQLQLYVAETARDRIFVHAGVVGWHGRAIVLPGHTFSGKTTLVAALIRAGATYYSDEYAVLDLRGWVHPYARPLSIREEGRFQGVKCLPERLGAHTGSRPLPVGLVALSQYRPGARWRPRPLSPGQAMLALMANTVPARTRPAAALEALQRVVAHATTVRGVRGEAEKAADALLRILKP
jgi:hypothetical protein